MNHLSPPFPEGSIYPRTPEFIGDPMNWRGEARVLTAEEADSLSLPAMAERLGMVAAPRRWGLVYLLDDQRQRWTMPVPADTVGLLAEGAAESSDLIDPIPILAGWPDEWADGWAEEDEDEEP